MYLPSYTRLMLDMHKREPITGDYLSIGRQTAGFTFEEAAEFLRQEGISPQLDVPVFPDRTSAKRPDWIDDRTFFSMFCDARVRALDVSKYEQADIIHDMNKPVPSKLHNIADFIFEGSCIDNMFNPAQAMLNIDLMLKPRGRLFMVNAGSIVPKDTFVALGEEWYENFLQSNGYKDISVESWSYDHVYDPVWHKGRQTITNGSGQQLDAKHCCVVVIARKSAFRLHQATQPMQKGYEDMHRPLRRKVATAALALPIVNFFRYLPRSRKLQKTLRLFRAA